MKKLLQYFTLLIVLLSCDNQSNSTRIDLENEMNERIKILEQSASFRSFIRDKNTDYLKAFNDLLPQLFQNVDGQELSTLQDDLTTLFSDLNVELVTRTDLSRNDLALTTIFGLDDVILKYTRPSLNPSNFSTVVIPEFTNIGNKEVLDLKIHLTSIDSLYEPEFWYIMTDSSGKTSPVLIESNKWTGHMMISTNYIKSSELKGFLKVSNELGRIDTFEWSYKLPEK